MCPKCKSRDRERMFDKIPRDRIFHCGDCYIIYADDGRAYVWSKEIVESFFCSDCGYEIGRWG